MFERGVKAVLIQDQREAGRYLAKYPVDTLFSTPVRPYLTVHRLDKGEFLFRGDADMNRLYFLVEGRAKTCIIHPNGQESLLAFPGPGTVMGDMELVGARTDAYLVEAVEPCVAIALALGPCRGEVLKDPKFLLCLCRLMADKLYAEDARFSALQAFPLKPKLADFILKTQAEGRYAEPLGRTARHLGVSDRHLQRLLAELCGEGILGREGRGYRVLDGDRLDALAADINSVRDGPGFLRFLGADPATL